MQPAVKVPHYIEMSKTATNTRACLVSLSHLWKEETRFGAFQQVVKSNCQHKGLFGHNQGPYRYYANSGYKNFGHSIFTKVSLLDTLVANTKNFR